MNEQDGRWITTKYGNRVFIRDKTEKTTNQYMNEKIRQSVIRVKAEDNEKEYKIPTEMIDRVYNSRRNPYNDQFADCYVASISPDDFLNLTTTAYTISSIGDDNKNRNYGKLDLNKINQGYMFLEIDMKSGKVTQHEGRHRMLLMKEAGYKDVEIMVFPSYGTSDRYNPITYNNKVVSNQQGTDFQTSIKQIIPLNKENYEKIKKER